MSDILLEELEVLESIYPTELSKVSDRNIEIDAEPDDTLGDSENPKVTLCVHYSDTYPDELPELSIRIVDGDLDDSDLEGLLVGLRSVGEENLGMAMTFTLVSHLRENLSELLRTKTENRKLELMEKERLEIEAEEARTRGTPVTVESFRAWKIEFDKELALKKAREEDEKMRGLTSKEREEYKRLATRLSGRQLFERNKHLEDDTLMEEGTVSVDFSQYERTRDVDEPQDEILTFSDSD